MSTVNNTPARTNTPSKAVDPSALMQIKSLSLRAKAVVDGFVTGIHRSSLRGFSVEFAEYRPYSTGDDPRTVDWKLLARTDRYYVKQFEDETNRRCYIALDQSRSMQYGTGDYSKAEYAKTFAATLAYYLRQQRDAVGVITCAGDNSTYLPPRTTRSHIQQIISILDRESRATETDLGRALSQLAGLSHRRGLIILLTDALVDPETIAKPLGYLRGRGHEIVIIRVLDRTEVDFQLPTSDMVEDLETGEQIFVNPEEARKDYSRRFDEHETRLLEVCHARQARLLTLVTDQPLASALLEFVSGSGSQTAKAAGGAV